MDDDHNRKDFAKRTSAAVGGLLTDTQLGGGLSAGQDRDAADKRLMLLGLNALARAHEGGHEIHLPSLLTFFEKHLGRHKNGAQPSASTDADKPRR